MATLLSHKYIAECGCSYETADGYETHKEAWNHGTLTHCPLHREAAALAAWLRALPFQGRETPTGGLVIGPEEWATARALLAKIGG